MDPGERSRLWFHEEALDILEGGMGTKKVEALCLETFDFYKMPHEHCFTNEEFGQLRNLRFLRVDYTDLAGDFKHLLSQLRWLQWRGCPGNFSPTNFHLKNLVTLDLTWSKIRDDWEAWSQIKMAKKLKVLNLSSCRGLTRTPDFSTFATLERLILYECRNLVQIDPSIGKLINLRVLDIAHSGITKLPDAIGNLEKLEEINALDCFNLQGEIPSNIGRLSSLSILILSSTKICSLPMSICGLSHLQTLDLTSCIKLQSLPELPPSLVSLCVTSKLMGTFPSLSNLMNLNELVFDSCLDLVELSRDIGKLSKLETLAFTITNISTLPVEIGSLSRLKKLKVYSCDDLQCILGLPSSLVNLSLILCASVERLPDLSNLKNLSELTLSECPELMEIQGLGKLESLMTLDVAMCEKLAKLDGLEQLETLRCLNTLGCESLERLPDLSNLKKLQKLDVSWCILLGSLLDLSNLKNLKQLAIRDWKNLTEIRGLEELKSLEYLDISGCKSIEKLPDLPNTIIIRHN